MKIIAFLPAKGSSDRIQSKNVKLLDGKPLFVHTLEKLVAINFIDEVYLDTESKEIVRLADDIDCKVLRRDPELASNKTDGNALLMNEVSSVDADIYIQILCTSPFIEVSTIKKAVDCLTGEQKYDSSVLVREDKLYTWRNGKPEYNIQAIPNSVDIATTTIETMGLYSIKKSAALKTKRRIGNNPCLIKASPLEAIDVNFSEDFDLAELIAAGRREEDRKLWANIKNSLTSAILSDILTDLGIKGIINGLMPNIPNVKLLGAAKTLKLRKLKKGEDPNGIYEALCSYNAIIPNDIIVVENELVDYAYFGELNANLAIRAGAIGTIIGGKTRDSKAVRDLNYPVFSKGYSCKDVRSVATVESINKRIKLNGINIKQNDLIFADREGVIVIPKNISTEVLNRAIGVAVKEKRILADISQGANALALVRKFGHF